MNGTATSLVHHSSQSWVYDWARFELQRRSNHAYHRNTEFRPRQIECVDSDAVRLQPTKHLPKRDGWFIRKSCRRVVRNALWLQQKALFRIKNCPASKLP